MRILFDAALTPFTRNFGQVCDSLWARGHEVLIALGEGDYPVNRFDVPAIENNMWITRKVFYRTDAFGKLSLWTRVLRDYTWYSTPGLQVSNKCRERCLRMLEKGITPDMEAQAMRMSEKLQTLDHEARLAMFEALSSAESCIPPDPAFDEYLRSRKIDLLLITPLVFTQYGQFDIIKSARRLGIPVFFLVYSWDNLTTKGVLHVAPDYVFVWNEHQMRELVELHGMNKEQVVIAGAPRFDPFFAMKPTPRAEFCARHGIDPTQPLIAYLGSWSFVAPREREVIQRIAAAIRESSDPLLRRAGLVLKPHPKTIEDWGKVKASEAGLAAICGCEQSNADQLLYDVIYHSHAAIGINTSAELEAAVLQKPVFTVLLPEFDESQSGSVHFKYLLKENGGHVEVTRSIEELCLKLAEAIRQESPPAHIATFVRSFLRPKGIDLPVAPAYADEIERIAQLMVRPPTGEPAGQPSIVAEESAAPGVSSNGEKAESAAASLMVRADSGAIPKVAVVVCTFNRLALLKQCIKSIRSHKSRDYGIIVIDAGSTDGTAEYLARLDYVTVVRDQGRIGQARSLNQVCFTLKSPYLCWLSDDNVLVPPSLDIARRALDENPGIGMIALKVKDKTGQYTHKPYLGAVAKTGIINCNQGMIRTGLFKAIGGFDETLRDYFIDVDLTTKVLLEGHSVAITKSIAIDHYRDHGNHSWIEPEARKERLRINQAFYELRYSYLVEEDARFHAGKEQKLRKTRVKRIEGLQRSRASFLLGAHTYNERDWHNLHKSRFVSTLDFFKNRGKEFYLVQVIPPRLRKDARSRIREVTMEKAAEWLAQKRGAAPA